MLRLTNLIPFFRMTMDLELIPLKLTLSALVTIEIRVPLVGSFRKTVFKKKLWYYQTPLIKKRIIDVSTKEEDKSPPQFSPVVQVPVGVIAMVAEKKRLNLSQMVNPLLHNNAF